MELFKRNLCQIVRAARIKNYLMNDSGAPTFSELENIPVHLMLIQRGGRRAMTDQGHGDRQVDPEGLERTRTVLLIDDDVVTRILVAHRIAGIGADVVEANDGIEALHYLAGSSVDLVIVDLEMPHMDGWEVISRIRGNPKTRHLPVIVLTGNDSPGALEESLRLGAISHLLKPLNWAAFGAQISQLLHGPHKAVQ